LAIPERLATIPPDLGRITVPVSNWLPPGKKLTALLKERTKRIILASSMVENEHSMIKKHNKMRINPE
jgi:hypothetical protein